MGAINSIADFVESKNTPGSGARFARKFMSAIEKFAKPNVQYALCNYRAFAAFGYSCRMVNDWVVGFKIVDHELIVYEIIHGSLLY